MRSGRAHDGSADDADDSARVAAETESRTCRAANRTGSQAARQKTRPCGQATPPECNQRVRISRSSGRRDNRRGTRATRSGASAKPPLDLTLGADGWTSDADGDGQVTRTDGQVIRR